MTDREMPEPGPERDALVATDVMGWELCHCKWTPYPHIDEIDSEDDSVVVFRPPDDYSTDPHAATDVLLAMQARGWDCEVAFTADTGGWYAQFDGEVLPLPAAWANDFPDAVTAAALRAVWAEQEAVQTTK